jgi:hypothetical protein
MISIELALWTGLVFMTGWWLRSLYEETKR